MNILSILVQRLQGVSQSVYESNHEAPMLLNSSTPPQYQPILTVK